MPKLHITVHLPMGWWRRPRRRLVGGVGSIALGGDRRGAAPGFDRAEQGAIPGVPRQTGASALPWGCEASWLGRVRSSTPHRPHRSGGHPGHGWGVGDRSAGGRPRRGGRWARPARLRPAGAPLGVHRGTTGTMDGTAVVNAAAEPGARSSSMGCQRLKRYEGTTSTPAL